MTKKAGFILALISLTCWNAMAANSTVSASPAAVAAEDTSTSTITVTLIDDGGNPTSGKTVTLAQTSGPGTPTITTVSGTTGGTGAATFTVKSATLGVDVFTATDVTDANPITQPLDPATGRFQYTRRATSGLTYKVLTSTTLLEWQPDGGASEVEVTTSGDVQTVTVHVSTAPLGGKLFVRVQAE